MSVVCAPLVACGPRGGRVDDLPRPAPVALVSVAPIEVIEAEAAMILAPPSAPAVSDAQRAAWLAVGPKNVLDAQLYRQTTTRAFTTPDGRSGTATLVDLAPWVQVWWVLTLRWDDGQTQTWHLENPSGLGQGLSLDDRAPSGLLLTRGAVVLACDLWGTTPGPLDLARRSGASYALLCDGALSLRNATVGSRTRLEWTTDLLRDHVWGGEAITALVKETFYEDAEFKTAELADRVAAEALLASGDPDGPGHGPRAASVAPDITGRLLKSVDLGLPVDGATDDMLAVGAWYPLHAVPDAWVSIMQPRFVDPAILAQNASRTRPLDSVEGPALVYTVAFDLSAFDLGYELGTDHPRVSWSEHAAASVRGPARDGPDGFGDLAPLARTGTLDPAYNAALVGVFVGGYKRAHGAMDSGALSKVNSGSHYGFVEFGAELSHLQPGLATLVVWADQRVEMLTWTPADAERLWQVRHARQNGVPVIETDPETGEARPGALVERWGDGNWSGSADGALRSVRGGLCIQDSPAGRFLLYSYFSAATPSAMAQVYSAYGCEYAMSLDMNALEHTYLAVHIREDGELAVRQLVTGMEVLDKQKSGATYPRFVGYADNRDFFYLTRR